MKPKKEQKNSAAQVELLKGKTVFLIGDKEASHVNISDSYDSYKRACERQKATVVDPVPDIWYVVKGDDVKRIVSACNDNRPDVVILYDALIPERLSQHLQHRPHRQGSAETEKKNSGLQLAGALKRMKIPLVVLGGETLDKFSPAERTAMDASGLHYHEIRKTYPADLPVFVGQLLGQLQTAKGR